jgi:hypothetical protein
VHCGLRFTLVDSTATIRVPVDHRPSTIRQRLWDLARTIVSRYLRLFPKNQKQLPIACRHRGMIEEHPSVSSCQSRTPLLRGALSPGASEPALECKAVALSRRKHGFESSREHQRFQALSADARRARVQNRSNIQFRSWPPIEPPPKPEPLGRPWVRPISTRTSPGPISAPGRARNGRRSTFGLRQGRTRRR